MAFRRRNIEKDPLEDLGSDLSDISDVKPEDLNKILKSANDLDNEIFAKMSPKNSSSELRGGLRPHKEIPQTLDAPLGELNLPSEEGTPAKVGTKSQIETEKEENPHLYRNRNRGSGDWLGLKDLTDNAGNKTEADIFKEPLFHPKSEPPKEALRSKTADALLPVKKDPTPKPATARKRVNILDDLFGDTPLKSEKKPDPLISTDFPENTEKKIEKYTPSLSAGRKLEKRKDTTPLGLGFDSDIDWVLGPKPSTAPPENSHKEPPPQPKTEVVNQGAAFQRSAVVEDKVLSQTVLPPPKAKTSVEVPDWLGGGPSEESQVSTALLQEKQTLESKPQDADVESVVGLLGNIQVQLGAAMARHNQNLQNYMQVLVNEARRMSLAEQLINPGKTISLTEISKFETHDDVSERKDEEVQKRSELSRKEEGYLETIRFQEDRIHDLEVKIARLEIQIEQLNVKIENNETMKNLEIENLKRTHELEVEGLEKRLERNKATYEEIIEEFEKKIIKMKKREEEAEIENKERIEALQAERIEELEKMKEYQKISLEHALSSQPIREMHFKPNLRPMDDIELSDREATLLEKEKQVETLKAELTFQKQKLDEAIEREKVMREERERETRRVLLEAKYKEETNNRELDRRKEQLDTLEKQIQQMRSEALKEQTELAKEKLTLAAEKARMEATLKIENSEGNLPFLQPLDMIKAKTEMEAALEAVKEARQAADEERRRHAEMRKVAEEITWEQKNKDQQLDMRERHILNIMKDAEMTKEEGIESLNRAEMMRKEIEEKEKELRAIMIEAEAKEKGFSKERLEIAKERLELDRQKSLLEAFLPTLQPSEELKIAPPKIDDKGYVDPKVLIMRLRAERDLGSFVTAQKL